MGGIAVVTDSTAYLPPAVVAEHGIRVVPLQVVIGGMPYDEDDVSPTTLADALRAWKPVTTSRPGPEVFARTYLKAAEEGCAAVVSVHLSGQMSGTAESAQVAAREAPIPVEVVDSRSLGMGMGFAVLTAVEKAATGAGVEEVAAAARRRALGATVVFYVDTLEHLRRGGRIGAATALLGSALAVKPLLALVDGGISPLEKVRTSSRAIARLEEVVVDRVGTGTALDVAVHHLANESRAEAVAARLQQRLAVRGEVMVSEVGAVVGAHVGPGMLAVVAAPI